MSTPRRPGESRLRHAARIGSPLSVFVSIAMLVALAGPALAADPTAARHAREGKRHYEAERWELALQEYRTAWDADPAPIFLYNQARCLQRLERYPEAHDRLEAYLEARPDSPARDKVEAALREIAREADKTHVRMEIAAQPPEATLTLDGDELGTAPQRRWLTFGSHTLAGTAPGFEPGRVVFTVGPARSSTVTLVLRPPAPAPALPDGHEEPAPLPDDEFVFPTAAWVTAGVALAGLGVGIGFDVAAHDTATDARSYSRRPDAVRAPWQSLVDDAEREQTIAWIGYGVAASAAVGTAIILWLSNPDRPDSKGQPTITVAPGSDSMSVQLRMGF